jgi:membrane protease YdiL (CAAX protease family)
MVKRILHTSLVKIIFGLLVCILVVTGIQIGAEKLLSNLGLVKETTNLLIAVCTAGAALFSYSLFFKFYEKRKITELGFDNFFKDAALGLGTGLVLQSLVILLISLNGGYTIVKTNPVLFLLPSVGMALASATVEEILFRGIIFRLAEEKLGSVIALIISAVIFGAVHLMNANSTIFSAISIALQAGVLLGASYIFTRNLWLPIFIHFAWNFAEAGIYGAAVSGSAMQKSLLTAEINGPYWLTGGEFGPENSFQATFFCGIAAVVFLVVGVKQNKLIKPFWQSKLKISS